MTEIDPAIVERAIDGWDATEIPIWKVYRDVSRARMREALHAIGLPELLRKAAEFDDMQMQLAGLTAQYEHATSYTVVHRGTLIYCSDAMRQAYSDQTVALDALLARMEAAPVGRVPFLKSDIAPGHVEVWFSIPVDVTLVSGKCVRLLEEPSNG